ncbi:TRAP transporter large permease subunit [Vitreoscilla massiliensis]|uniref:TRAP transporter large permease subunit n=1 Tax=Vitreoscilla massiliensis TaxID=1689272 RepID=A0ABY4E4E9_9NEIS|nr:Na+/H+ antiporter NhaC family protein [Vitreoscilla massiliensis]UOO90641.1 TRAP transporter large permease subunit [Vitreoscilla massiliensis]
MNSVVIAVFIVVILSLMRVSVVLSLMVGAIIAGLLSGMDIKAVVEAFNAGLGGGAPIALAYATLGAFAVVLSRTGITQHLSDWLIGKVNHKVTLGQSPNNIKWALYIGLILVGFTSGTIIPVHIAFIPILIPPLLHVMNKLQLDRRAVACAITFSLIVMYMTFPIGYGVIYLNDIMISNINKAGAALNFSVDKSIATPAMLIPSSGMVIGLIIALFISYRKKRTYSDLPIEGLDNAAAPRVLQTWQKALVLLGIVLALITQLWTGSMIFGGLVGFAIVSMSGVIKWQEQDHVFTQGMRLMAMVGFIMITATGFAAVMTATGDVPALVESSVAIIGDNKGLAAFMMLLIGLFVTMGIGSSFSTVPILTAIYVPLCVSFGFSPMATVAIIGAAGALGDAGSPASDSTLGPTAGLNADGQHDHMWDTVVPTFIHYNLPLICTGWIAAMVL